MLAGIRHRLGRDRCEVAVCAAAPVPSDVHELQAEVAAAVERANAKLARVEQIKRYRLLERDWLPGSAEVTPP